MKEVRRVRERKRVKVIQSEKERKAWEVYGNGVERSWKRRVKKQKIKIKIEKKKKEEKKNRCKGRE